MDGAGDPRHSLVARVEAHARERDAMLDRDAARRRGVVHTPGAIARFVARAADEVLRNELGKTRGLGASDVVIADPATGPGVFLAAALELAEKGAAPRACIGLDVDEAALARAEAVLGPAALERGWPLRLACADALASLAPVAELEDDDVTRVVIGNPPWAARTANRDAALTEALLDDFRRDEHGASLGERRIGVLSDDYVRFFRWGAELVRRARRGGVLAIVTNASFLDGPVHRAMRAALARWMDRVDVIDLGGSSLVARAGGADENVFGVRPAVAITIAVRSTPHRAQALAEPSRHGTLRIAALRGTKHDKLDALDRGAIALEPRPIDRPWSAHLRRSAAAYAQWPSLAEWMPFHREGLQTNRDELVVALDRDALIAKLDAFARGRAAHATDHWAPEAARAVARALLDDEKTLDASLRRVAYRPFDERWAVVHPALCHRARPELARAIDASPFALVTARKDRGQLDWMHFGAVAALPDNCWLSTRSSCRARAFPLRDPGGADNLDARLAAECEARIGRALDVDSFACWALAWMSCRAFRDAEGDALRADYPRVPIPRDARELDTFAAHGRAIVRAFLDSDAPVISVRVEEGPALGRVRVRGDTVERGGVTIVRDLPDGAAALRVGHHVALARWIEGRDARDPDAIARAVARIHRVASVLRDADHALSELVTDRLRAEIP